MIETKFKQTELGPIPEDWTISTLSECSQKITDGSHFSPTECESSPFYMPSVKDMGETDFVLSDCKRISKDSYLSLKKMGCCPQIGDVVIAKDGSILKSCFPITNNRPLVVLSSIAIISPLKDLIDGLFLSKYFKFTPVKSYVIENYRGGTGVPRIILKNFAKLPLYYPSTIREQRQIAESLNDVDDLIRELNTLIGKKSSVMQGSIQEFLSAKRRLPGFSAPWTHIILGDTVTIYRGGSPRPIENFITTNPNGLNWIKIGDVRPKDKYIVQTAEKIIPEGLSSTREVHVGDFILSNSMSFGRPYILKIDGCIHDGWLAITNYENTFDKDYLYYLLGSDSVYKQYLSLAAGSGVLNLNKKLVAAVELDIPDIEEQKAISTILSDMDAEITELETKRNKYAAIRQGMMQQLLTGKIRLI